MTNRLILSAFALTLAACVADPAKDAPKATVAPVATTATPAPTPAAPVATTTDAPAAAKVAAPVKGAEILPIDTTASKLLWTASKVTRTHPGGFKTFKGTIALAGGKAEKSTVELEIDIDSIFTNEIDLVNHLKSPDFFDAAAHPKATFKSTAITPAAEAGATHIVKGILVLHGVTREISFPATITVEEKQVTAKARFSFNRQDFKIAYKGAADDLVRDDVLIEWDITAKRG